MREHWGKLESFNSMRAIFVDRTHVTVYMDAGIVLIYLCSDSNLAHALLRQSLSLGLLL